MTAHPLLPDFESPPKLVGIARIAAAGESLREGHNVEYFTLGTRSLLNRVVSRRNLPFTWAINPYRGCEFACKYCYARYTHEFMELRDGVEFERKIFVKQQAAALLRSELKKVKRGEEIAIGTATDPYQPAERRFEVTRAILEELALHSGLEIGIVTKSNLVTRDAEILRRVGEHNRVFVNVTVTTVDAELARKLEPRAPRPDLRLEAVCQLNLAGVDAGVFCGGVPAVSGRTLPRSGAALPGALCRSRISAKRVRAAAIAIDGRLAAKVRNWRSARPKQSRSAYDGRANGIVLRRLELAGGEPGVPARPPNYWTLRLRSGRTGETPVAPQAKATPAYNVASAMTSPQPTVPPPHRIKNNARQFWYRVSEGLAVNQLWSQFEKEARSSYRLYSAGLDKLQAEPSRLKRVWQMAKALFWAILEKLTPARRVLLLLALILLFFPGGGFTC